MQEKLKDLEVKHKIEWQKTRISTLFEIEKTKSFNKSSLTDGNDYDYVTRTSQNQGILQTSGFVNKKNINEAGTWSLGLLQMDFFYRDRPWYAGQFVRKITSKIKQTETSILFFTAILNKFKPALLSHLVRDVDNYFLNSEVELPLTNDKLNYDFMHDFIQTLEAERTQTLEAERTQTLEAYLMTTGLKSYELTIDEERILSEFQNSDEIQWKEFKFQDLFDHIEQGRRLKKKDQISGNLPFIMSGTTDQGLANHIGNDVKVFPPNSITIDIFGNAFYRDYEYGMGDDTGSYWNEKKVPKLSMLFITALINKSLFGRYDYGHKLRSSRTYKFKLKLPSKNGEPDYEFMNKFIAIIQKIVIKDLVKWTDKKIELTKRVI